MASKLKAPVWMVLACMASVAVVAAVARDAVDTAFVAGMLGPLVAVAASWAAIDRAARRDPASVARQMLGAFFVKAVFFAAYVVVALRVLRVEPKPFIVSFTCYFVGLYVAEALLLRRRFVSAPSTGHA